MRFEEDGGRSIEVSHGGDEREVMFTVVGLSASGQSTRSVQVWLPCKEAHNLALEIKEAVERATRQADKAALGKP
ncbi:hypothetical protein [Deinococcus saxicola]|uniref:hypothetical protein n=1 Tax=Deinococcus saxicola TaxID=249406 RepID=UPI0039EE4957